MPLPIIDSRHAASQADLVRLFHQTEERWTAHLGETHSLDIGTAYSNRDFATVYDANNIRDVALPDGMTPEAALAMVSAHYEQRQTRCAYWVMNASSPESATRPMAEYLLLNGYRANGADIMLLTDAPRRVVAEAANLKIIPARASFRHARMLAEESARRWNAPRLVDAFMRHMDDPHWDMLLALRDGVAAGCIGVLAVGEIGRVEQFYVAEAFRGQGIGQTLLRRILEICARSLFRHVMLWVLPDNSAAVKLYAKVGFERIGQFTAHLAPGVQSHPRPG
ncbi:MAG: GNAT family N-acetyltransferase [Planctomycetota bacterium]|nr:GNAT family N-acetyltransferase [Planctomycetota bacterium]